MRISLTTPPFPYLTVDFHVIKMATDTLIRVLVVVLIFVTSSFSRSCNDIGHCTDLDGGSTVEPEGCRCMLDSSYVAQGCNDSSENFSMKFNGINLKISELVIANMIFEGCTKPIYIEDMMAVEITNVNFR